VRSQTLAHRPDGFTFGERRAANRVTDQRLPRPLVVTQQPQARAIAQDLTLQCLDAWGRAVDLPATFGYDAADPWAVWITFRRPQDQVRWAVGRDLLLQGLTDPAGEGDIQLWPSIDEHGRAAVVMELCSPGGRLVTQLHTHELYRFLTRTLALVPVGSETIDLDGLVAELTGTSPAE
jgi:hypothetical protein